MRSRDLLFLALFHLSPSGQTFPVELRKRDFETSAIILSDHLVCSSACWSSSLTSPEDQTLSRHWSPCTWALPRWHRTLFTIFYAAAKSAMRTALMRMSCGLVCGSAGRKRTGARQLAAAGTT